ncbi:MAG TPA: helix-turn-helix domain-containing protein [Bacteroidales bacterium]|nr:helix-turn-helix domain-containing protein [Bacteroidales bacterium]
MEQEILIRLKKIEGLLSELRANQPKEFLSIDEVAKLLNVTRPTLWDWDRKGILKKRHIGNVVRYRKSDIDKILNR